MKTLISILLILTLGAYVHCACQTSTSKSTLVAEITSQFTGSSTNNQELLQVLEDSAQNVYEIGRIYDSAKFFIRKASQSGTTVWAKVYPGYYAFHMSNALINNDAQISMCSSTSSGYYHYIEINTSDGSVNRIRNTGSKYILLSQLTAEMCQCSFTPSKNYLYMGAFDDLNSYASALLRHSLSNPDGNVETSTLASTSTGWFTNSAVAISETNIITLGLVNIPSNGDSVGVGSFTWAATPTVNWCKKYLTSLSTTSQNMRAIASSDGTKVINVVAATGNVLLVHVFNVADGTLLGKGKASGGFTSRPWIYGIALKDTSSLLVTATNGKSGQGTIFEFALTDYTGSAYTASESTSFFSGLSGPMNFNSYWMGGADTTNKKYTTNKFSSIALGSLSLLFSASSSFTLQQITNTDFDPTDHTITPAASTTRATVAATLTPSDDTVTISTDKLVILNSWPSATAQTITGGTTGGTFSPEYYCIASATGVTAPTVTYSLVAGSGSVPSWVSVDSSTGVITYNAPNTASTESFSLRSTFAVGSGLNYDTIISLTVTATPADNSGSSKSCGITSGVGECVGVIGAIVIGALVIVFVIILVTILIIKKRKPVSIPVQLVKPENTTGGQANEVCQIYEEA